MIRRAIVNVAVGAWYPVGQRRLMESIEERGENATRLFWTDEYPPGSPAQHEALYAFKMYALDEARELGFDRAVWVDASCWAIRGLDTLWGRLAARGWYFEPDGNPVGPWCNDNALRLLNLTRDQAMEYMLIEGKLFGLDFGCDVANEWLDEMLRLADAGAFGGELTNDDGSQSPDPRCRGHRGDIPAGSVVAARLGMTVEAAKMVWFPSNGEAPESCCLMSQGM